MMKSWFVPVLEASSLHSSCLSMPVSASAREPVDAVMYVAPIPAGRADGSRWSDAASIRRLPELLGFLPAGGEILVRADQGPYHLQQADRPR